jgi:DNA-binding response OmpR family regulator
MVRILIVDDDSNVRSALRQKLEDMGHRVRDASNGRNALLIADKQQPDIAIVDILMPEMDGIEIIKEFRRKHYHFPIIAMPSHGTTKRAWYGDIARMFGADDVLEKPFTPKEVETIVSRLIKQGT